jgi:hypothetical protein
MSECVSAALLLPVWHTNDFGTRVDGVDAGIPVVAVQECGQPTSRATTHNNVGAATSVARKMGGGGGGGTPPIANWGNVMG